MIETFYQAENNIGTSSSCTYNSKSFSSKIYTNSSWNATMKKLIPKNKLPARIRQYITADEKYV